MAGLSDGPFIGSLCLSLGLSLLFSAVILSGRLFHLELLFLLIFELLSHLGVLIFEFECRGPGLVSVFGDFLALHLLLHDLVSIAQATCQLGAVKAPRPASPHSVLFIDFAGHVLLGHLLARELKKLSFSLSSEHALESERARVVLSCSLFFSQWVEPTALVSQEVA